jgi:carboxyl-terminal processing protease
MWDEWVKAAAKDTLQLTTITGRKRELLQIRLKALLARYKWRNTGFYQVLNSDDASVRKAMELVKK